MLEKNFLLKYKICDSIKMLILTGICSKNALTDIRRSSIKVKLKLM